MNTREHDLQSQFLQGLSGNAAAYHAFLRALAAHLRAYFRRRLSSLSSDIEDLVQETLLAIHHQRHTYQSHRPLTAWVHAIARYKLIDLVRSHAVREHLHDSWDDEMAVFAHSDIDALEAQRDLAVLLEQLPPQQRLPIEHMKLEGLSVTETAQLTGMSESAVKVGVHRGLKALAAMVIQAKSKVPHFSVVVSERQVAP
jgi:RNA polymerase sigma-70 factor, ECF subfamily